MVRNVLAIRQNPPAKACPFDLYVWVPIELRPLPGSGAPGDGSICVDYGSNVMDGGEGAVQYNRKCANEFTHYP
eukprot:2230661-Prymnesium_polylepis.1